MLLLIDNYDSFTNNLLHMLQVLPLEVKLIQNDELDLSAIKALKPSHIILSPGPGSPNDAGVCEAVLAYFKDKVPILGVCLGHQVIAQHFGAAVVGARQIMHGKTSCIKHNSKGIFAGLPDSFIAMRYHSLLIDPFSMPVELEIAAWTEDKEIMAIQHKTYPIFGVQFHPESILTQCGEPLLQHFVGVG